MRFKFLPPFLSSALVVVLAVCWFLFMPAEYQEWELVLLIFLLCLAVFAHAWQRPYYRKLTLLDPNYKLIRDLEEKAPGTYHHSMQIAALAQHAARQFPNINLLDLRLGCLLHDLGKLKQAEYFTENQSGASDKFDDKHLERRRELILQHGRDGLELAKHYDVPRELWSFIESHHGTSLTGFYYSLKGEEAATESEKYRYGGPKPPNLATAIVMLADSVEAAARAMQGKDLEEVVTKVFQEKITDEQFEDVPELTLEKLAKIKNAFLEVLQFVYHTRTVRKEEKQAKP